MWPLYNWRYKDLSMSHDEQKVMTLLPPMEKCPIEYPIEPFQLCLPAVQRFDVSKLLHAWRYINFQTGHFADFKQLKVDIHFANFGQVKIDPICFFLLL